MYNKREEPKALKNSVNQELLKIIDKILKITKENPVLFEQDLKKPKKLTQTIMSMIYKYSQIKPNIKLEKQVKNTLFNIKLNQKFLKMALGMKDIRIKKIKIGSFKERKIINNFKKTNQEIFKEISTSSKNTFGEASKDFINKIMLEIITKKELLNSIFEIKNKLSGTIESKSKNYTYELSTKIMNRFHFTSQRFLKIISEKQNKKYTVENFSYKKRNTTPNKFSRTSFKKSLEIKRRNSTSAYQAI